MVFSFNSGDPLTESLGEKTVECAKHGAYTATGTRFIIGRRREVWTSCPECAKEQAQQAAEAERALRAKAGLDRVTEALRQAAIPARFIGRSFDNFIAETDEQKRALAICREFAENFDRHHAAGDSLILSGAAGTGKSHLATAILQHILPGRVGAYMTFMGMIRAIRDTWRSDSPRSESQVIADLGSLPLLVLDEIGVQYGTEAEHTLLFEVMDRRYRDRKPTILLTNQGIEGFKRFVGDRVYDRLRETARWVNFPWASYRRQAREG